MAFLPPNNQQQNVPKTGSGFTNLQKIISANQNNKLGSSILGGVNQVGQGVRNDINTAGQDFQTGVAGEKTRQSNLQNKANTVLGDVSKAGESDYNDFQNILGGQSQGPNGLFGADQLIGEAQQAKQLGQAGSTEGGRLGLLQRFAGSSGNKYSQGQQRLDSLLLGQTGAGQLKQARQATSGLQNQAQNQATAATEVGKELQGNAQNLANTTNQALVGQIGGYDTDLQARATAAQANRDATIADVQNQLKNNTLNQDTLNAIGLKGGEQIWNTDLGKYITVDNTQANKFNVENDADLAKINALRNLSGNFVTGDASNILNQFQDTSQANTYNALSPYTYNKEALQQDINDQANAYQAAINPDIAQQKEANRQTFGNAADLGVIRGQGQDILNKYGLNIVDDPHSGYKLTPGNGAHAISDPEEVKKLLMLYGGAVEASPYIDQKVVQDTVNELGRVTGTYERGDLNRYDDLARQSSDLFQNQYQTAAQDILNQKKAFNFARTLGLAGANPPVVTNA